MWRRARPTAAGSVLPEWVSSALPSKTRKPDHQSACEISTEQRGSRSRFLNFIRVSVMEIPTPQSRGYTVTMLSWGIPFRRNEVRTPCGLSWTNCSIWGASGAAVGISPLLSGQVGREKALCFVEALPRGMRLEAGMGAHGEAVAGAVVEHELTGFAERPHPILHPAHALERGLLVLRAVQDQRGDVHALHQVVRLHAGASAQRL